MSDSVLSCKTGGTALELAVTVTVRTCPGVKVAVAGASEKKNPADVMPAHAGIAAIANTAIKPRTYVNRIALSILVLNGHNTPLARNGKCLALTFFEGTAACVL
jgi:hypothetical protein